MAWMDYVKKFVRYRFEKAFSMACTSPGIVYSFALISTGRPCSRKVADVTGPIEDIRIPLIVAGAVPAFISNNWTKFFTVDELVNVTTSGRRSLLLSAARSLFRDARGTTVS